jgi:hypothetical protein
MNWPEIRLVTEVVVLTGLSLGLAGWIEKFGQEKDQAPALLRMLIGVMLIGVLVYGVFEFPDAPYSPCHGATGYCGKWGIAHSPSEFRRFSVWQTTLLVVWPAGMLIVLVLNRLGHGRRNRDPNS